MPVVETGRTVKELVDEARDEARDVAARHDAFASLVRRFQDFAYSCAFAVLGDSSLAEDAAQDAFLVAWQQLDQVREPAAFGGWLRRLVATQCNRRLRSPRLLVPLDSVTDVPVADDGPEARLDAGADVHALGEALARLSPSDRLVIVLRHGEEWPQSQIATWLGVPITTVARRLAHARRRLRGLTLEQLALQHRDCRPSRNEAFVVELSSRIRPATREDLSRVAGLARTVGLLAETADRTAMRHTPYREYSVDAPGSERLIAYGAAMPTRFQPVYVLELALSRRAFNGGIGDILLGRLLQDLTTVDARAVIVRLARRQRPLATFLSSRDFTALEQPASERADRELLERVLIERAPVTPTALDELVGVYEPTPETIPAGITAEALTIRIERFHDILVSAVGRVHDRLFPINATEFVTTHHFGRTRFERDETGRFTRLVYTEGRHLLVARRTTGCK